MPLVQKYEFRIVLFYTYKYIVILIVINIFFGIVDKGM